MEKYVDYIDDSCYTKIIIHGNNMYTIDSSAYTCEGFYKSITDGKYEVRLDKWYDKKTKRCKGKTNKLFNHTQGWFGYMVEKGLKS